MSELSLSVQGVTLQSQELVKLLGVIIDKGLRFNEHVTYICKKAAQQLNSMSRLSSVLQMESKYCIFNTFIISNFVYCPLIWHMCSSADAQSIEKIQKRSLRFVLNDFTSEYGILMEKSSFWRSHGEVMEKSTFYLEKLRQLHVETYKATNGLAPVYVWDIFQRKIHVHSYSLRDTNTLSLCKFNTIKYGKLSLRYEASNISNKLPPSVKCVQCLDDFKKSTKTWKGPLCMCGSCMLCAFKL